MACVVAAATLLTVVRVVSRAGVQRDVVEAIPR